MTDKCNIVNFLLKDFYIKENHALYQKIIELEEKLDAKEQELNDKKMEVERLGRRINNRNHDISVLQQRLQFNDQFYQQRLRLQKILVSVDGALFIFQRNDEGVFVRVPEDPDATESESEHEPRTEEEAEDIARRLGFESDSDGYISDDLMRSLLDE